MDHGNPSSNRWAGNPAATGARGVALLEFPGFWQLVLIGPSLLLTASGTQRAPHSRDFLYWSAASAGVCRERSTVMVSLPAHDSEAAPCLHGCPAFLQKHPPPWTFSPWPTAVRALGLLSNPHAFLAPSPVHSGGLASLSRVCRAGAQIFCVVLTPFRLSR